MNIIVAPIEVADTLADFQVKMAFETEQLSLNPETVRRGVQKIFDHPELGFYLICQVDQRTIASLMITYEWSDWRSQYAWWIQSLYVVPEYRKKGVFKAMYQYLQNEVSNRDEVGGIRLYVDKSNVSAQKVYEAVGMNGDHYHLYESMKVF